MNSLTTTLEQLKKSFHLALEKASDADQIEEIRIAFLGRNGHIAAIMDQLKELSLEDKRSFGPLVNEFKTMAQDALNNKKSRLEHEVITQKLQTFKDFDVSAYTSHIPGSLHVYTHLIRKIQDISISMGYQEAQGPEVETDYYNFGALNIPDNHPARDTHDTFWLTTPGLLMRTHTSTVQIRTMENSQPPIAIFAPGRTFRNEATDATHDFQFMQVEGFLIDTDISISHLLATVQVFLQEVFERKDLNIRVLPDFFPFVEPGLQISAQCPFCSSGCSICKKTGWIEIMGAGMVHPNVLKATGIDPEKYSGFAFGFGLARLAMIKYGIHDIRLLNSTQIEVLEQLG